MLTAAQTEFAICLARGMSQRAAYQTAYPKSRTWSIGAVHAACWRLAVDPKIKAYVAELRAMIADVEIATVQRMVEELSYVALADPRQLLDEKGKVIPFHKLPEEVARAISSVKLTVAKRDDGTSEALAEYEVKFWDKGAAADKALKVLGGYGLDNKQRTDPLAELLRQLRPTIVEPGKPLIADDGDDDSGAESDGE